MIAQLRYYLMGGRVRMGRGKNKKRDKTGVARTPEPSPAATGRDKPRVVVVSRKQTASKREKAPTTSEGRSWLQRMESGVWGLCIAVMGILFLLALVTYDRTALENGGESGNLIGPVGAWLAHILFTFTGWSAYVICLALAVFGAALVGQRAVDLHLLYVAGATIVALPLMALMDLLPVDSGLRWGGGGMFGHGLAWVLKTLVGQTGTILICLGAAVVGLALVLRIHVKTFFLVPYRLAQRLVRGLLPRRKEDGRAGEEKEAAEERRAEPLPSNGSPRIVRAGEEGDDATRCARPGPPKKPGAAGGADAVDSGASNAKAGEQAGGPPPGDQPSPSLDSPSSADRTAPGKPGAKVLPKSEPSAPGEEAGDGAEESAGDTAPEDGVPDPILPRPRRKPRKRTEPRAYVLPNLDHLDQHSSFGHTVDEDSLHRTAQKLEEKLRDFKIDGVVGDIHPGPVVALYEFKPGRGIKVSAIEALYKDIAMAVEAEQVRVIAPIPGRDVVGFEIPNRVREMVYLRDLLTRPKYAEGKQRLPIVLGKDIAGEPAITDLTKMPHLLVAGTTGSGKSVALHAFILSLLYRMTPDQLRFIFIDTKMLELTAYEDVPHLLVPVVTEAGTAAIALRWAVGEMERRNRLMSQAGVPNIFEYNQFIRKRKETPSFKATIKKVSKGPDGQRIEEVVETDEDEAEELPYIVVIIDELADLMMVAGKNVESSVARLAQMARAAGIHMVIATQNPTIKVVTGIIKANMPSRISFKVRTMQDSRVVLDQNGADCLLGNGDMLFLGPGSSALQRIHGAFVSTEERTRVVEFLRAQGEPEFNDDILNAFTAGDGEEESVEVGAGGEGDDLYDQAVRIAIAKGRVSTSAIQRELGVGYPKAAKFMSRMEREGLVGPQEAAGKPREVLRTR
jgi:DNA segregation ATPase FtsK/SpoIIIE-like protein